MTIQLVLSLRVSYHLSRLRTVAPTSTPTLPKLAWWLAAHSSQHHNFSLLKLDFGNRKHGDDLQVRGVGMKLPLLLSLKHHHELLRVDLVGLGLVQSWAVSWVQGKLLLLLESMQLLSCLSQTSSIDFQPCPLCTEMSPDHLNLLMILCTLDYKIFFAHNFTTRHIILYTFCRLLRLCVSLFLRDSEMSLSKVLFIDPIMSHAAIRFKTS